MTGHFITNDFKPAFVVLGSIPISERHTGDNISEYIKSRLELFEVQNKIHMVLRDGGNIVNRHNKRCILYSRLKHDFCNK